MNNKLLKLAQKIENKLNLDPSVTITEHKGIEPKAYMAFANLKNIIADS